MRKLNIAMIGYKFMGKAHSNAWRQVGRFFDIPFEPVMKVICGRDEQGVAKAARTFGWEEYVTSVEQVIARDDIDVIDICTPGDSHMEIAIAAAEAKKVLFCEKPLANNLDESQKMLAAAQKNGVIHMVCHNYRRAPAVMLAKQLITEGTLGEIYHYRGVYLQDGLVDPNFPRVWRLEKSRAGSGALGDIA
ncbi:MAG: Gfo/Idh/MocA family protein, partial [Pyrinomonadaceae bacterium]